MRATVYVEVQQGADPEAMAGALRGCLEGLGVKVVAVKVSGKRPGRPPYPFPVEEVRRLLSLGLTIANVHRLLVLEGRICVDRGPERECMKYETFRLKVKELLARQESSDPAPKSANYAH